MKKLIAILLCTLMLLSSALAEQNMQAWNVVIDNIEITKDNETVSLNPTLHLTTGRDSAGCWAQAQILLNDENVLTGQVEYTADTIFTSVDGAKDALLINGADLFLNQFALTAEQAQLWIDTLFGLLSTGYIPEIPGVEIKPLSENEAAVTVIVKELTVSARIAWTPAENVIPYDLSEKNVCRYTFREMFPGDGTDIPETVMNALSVLNADSSVQALTELLSGVENM